jgi:hypothetical protein
VTVEIPVTVTGEGGAQTAGAAEATAAAGNTAEDIGQAKADAAAPGDGPNDETDESAEA